MTHSPPVAPAPSPAPALAPAPRPTRPAARCVARMPLAIRPYLELMRVDRPVGTWLVVLPGWTAVAMAADARPGARVPLTVAVLFAVGFLTRGAGCTVNDILDRRFDARVTRTTGRPLAAGTIGVRRAWAFFGAQCLVALPIPLLLGPTPFLVMAAGWVPIVAYPLMKRITDWPHVWLGPCMSWLVPVGWLAVAGSLDVAAVLLFVGMSCWAVGCDLVYAHQDRASDAVVGVRSAAVRLGRRSVSVLVGVYVATIGCLAGAGVAAGLGWAFWPLLALAAGHLVRQLRALDIDDPACCQRVFLTNPQFAALVLVAVLAGRIR
ncbi:4-hydroxybenzoate octaprenyltransferase [Embleya sp. AB8]|uniref:4-hydroxybenzoate octaprenyltransferase n=1 Tax=Embleya sp. AB8 TaxID=3156304 RepID=UPI003C75618E